MPAPIALILEFGGSGQDALPPYSSRVATQTLDPIAGGGEITRDVNGEVIDLVAPQFRLLKSTISCTDRQPLAVNGVWRGMLCICHCIAKRSYRTLGGSPDREVRSDVAAVVQGDFTIYRPKLTMVVFDYRASFDDWGALVSWQLDLEEKGP